MDVKPDSKTYSSSKFAHVSNNSSILKSDGSDMKVMGHHKDTISVVKAKLNEGMNSRKTYVDVDVDTIVSVSATGENSAAAEDGNSTEYSSSFDGTVSDTENFLGFDEAEVESTFYDHSSMASAYDAFDSVFSLRKKKLTAHWRNFIHPLMWRCKWAELKIREIKSQLSKYSKELESCDQAKYPELEQYASDDFGLRSQPYSGKFYEKKALKRRKRKRAEHAEDVSSYMSSHNLFSYYGNKRSGPDGPSVADEFNNSVITYQDDNDSDDFSINTDRLFFKVRGGDNALELALLKIERAQSHAQKLKSQLDILISRHAVKCGSSENLSLLEQNSSLPSPTFSSANGDIISSRAIFAPVQHIQEYYCGDLVLPESAVSSFAEANSIPDIIESTVGMLSATEVTAHQPHMGDSHETIVDNVLLREEVTESERRTWRTTAENIERQKGEQAENNDPCTSPASGHELVRKGIVSSDLETSKPLLASNFCFQNKRKRGERKPCSRSWNKRQSLERDS